MKVIPPLTITDAMLTSNAPEPGAGEVVWVSGTTYAVGDVRILTSTHRKYERLTAGSGTVSPDTDTTNWLDVGPTNRWAMFDTLRNTTTEIASPLTVSIVPGSRINALAVMGLTGEALTVTVTVLGVVKYTNTSSLVRRNTTSWSGYFFGEFKTKPAVTMFDLPPYAGATINLTITNASGNVQCGALVVGNAVDIGSMQYSPTSGALNFSKIERDDFGGAVLVPRRSVPKTDQTLWLNKSSVNKSIETRALLNAVPAVWSGLDDMSDHDYFDALLILGIYKEWAINLEYPDAAKVTLSLEEI